MRFAFCEKKCEHSKSIWLFYFSVQKCHHTDKCNTRYHQFFQVMFIMQSHFILVNYLKSRNPWLKSHFYFIFLCCCLLSLCSMEFIFSIVWQRSFWFPNMVPIHLRQVHGHVRIVCSRQTTQEYGNRIHFKLERYTTLKIENLDFDDYYRCLWQYHIVAIDPNRASLDSLSKSISRVNVFG